jgi:Uncharacterized conserved protein
MKYFIDEYRGFQNLIIELKNINFFVGENSTGKTSLISAITILSDIRLWLTGDIPIDLFDYSTFEDIHSLNSVRPYFTMGIVDDDHRSIHLINFKDDNGLPKAYQEIIFSEDVLIVLGFSIGKIQYRYLSNYLIPQYTNQSMKELLDFIDSKDFKKNKQKEIHINNLIGQRLPFSVFRQVIQTNDIELSGFLKNKNFITDIFNEGVTSLAPIRAKPLPLYSGSKQAFSNEGSHTPYILKDALSKGKNIDIVNAIRSFGCESGLFTDIEPFIYGDKQIAPFELLIRRGEGKYKISSVGYGVSQILPIIVDILFSPNPIIMIQQPEVHLHPKAQAAFGEFLCKMSINKPKRKIIIETHSDYIIDRFRFTLKESDRKVSAKINFFSSNGKNNYVQDINIEPNGKYENVELSSFRSFFINETFKLMEI